ncbi:hypothetical protein [Abyssisolibacter fermentans]|uniref:hypothetical protein n=1 Tax=Abyssisolibacter fermentans TaxID=1766203 RepID=UPI0012E39070|nr:hypothetical protein [Abyssisolibacter fermentans]
MAVICHYALHKLHKYPSEILGLPDKERAFIIASIKQKIEDDKRERDKIKAQSNKKR